MSQTFGPSGSPYIIICAGRIGVAVAKSADEKACAAGACASDFAHYMGLRYRQSITPDDLAEVSSLQHQLMEAVQGKAHDVDQLVSDLFDAMYAVEQKFTGVAY